MAKKDETKHYGTVKFFNEEKQFGFVTPESGIDIYLNGFELQSSGHNTVSAGEPIEFEIRETPDGRRRAANIRRLIYDDKNLRKLIEHLQLSAKRPIRLLIVGQMGVGKSSTINRLLGKKVAKESAHTVGTPAVTPYQTKINGVHCTVYDTPGLSDAVKEEGRDAEYIEMMKAAIEGVDCLLYFTKLVDRFRPDEVNAINVLSAAFGKDIWRHALIVLTMADHAASERDYVDYLKNRPKAIRKEVSASTDSGIGEQIPAVATTNQGTTTPDGKTWLDELFTTVLLRLNEEAQLPFFSLIAHRLTTEESAKESTANKESVTSREMIILKSKTTEKIVREKVEGLGPLLSASLNGAQVGVAIGILGGPTGAAVGTLVGAAVGAALQAFGRLFRRR